MGGGKVMAGEDDLFHEVAALLAAAHIIFIVELGSRAPHELDEEGDLCFVFLFKID